jgi:hypothetical protein
MMGLDATITEPWELVDIDCTEAYRSVEETVRDKDGNPVMVTPDEDWKPVSKETPEEPPEETPEEGEGEGEGEGGEEEEEEEEPKIPKRVLRYEKRKHYVLKIKRKLVSLIAYGEAIGKTEIAFHFLVASDRLLNYASTGKIWRCTRDAVGVQELYTGECVQEQTWEYFGPWESVDKDAFG